LARLAEPLSEGCGSGNATIPAARTGAEVTGLDLVPELLESGRAEAREAGVEIEWVEGDAENLPFDDGSFDVSMSAIGAMFAPDHKAAAGELARVAKPGGVVANAAWTPEGNTGVFFATLTKHMPPPPEGFQSPVLWGTEDHLREIFEGTDVELEFERHAVHFEFVSVDAAVEIFEEKFGPVVAAREALEPQGKWEAARADLVTSFEGFREEGSNEAKWDGEYLVAVGRKS